MNPTAALDIEYARAITARFTTKRDGTPMACMTCGTPLEMGKAFAAKANEGWHSYCERCAASTQAQIAGLVRRIETLVEPLGTNVPTDITDMVAAAEQGINDILGPSALVAPAAFIATKQQLLRIRAAVGAAKAAGQPAPVRTNQYGGKCVTCKVWVEPGTGRIEKQGGRWVTFHLDGQCPTPQAAPTITVAEGLYLSDDGTVRKVYMTRNARLAAKTLHIIAAGINADGTTKYRGSFQYAAGAIKLIADGIAAGTTHLMTEAEASLWGQQWSFCCNCGLYLDDDRSVAAGYGPTCADNKGWRYPTYEEAAVILGRPAGPNKGQQAQAEDAPQPVAEGVKFCEYCDEAVTQTYMPDATETWRDLWIDHLGSETCSGDDAHGPNYYHNVVVEAEQPVVETEYERRIRMGRDPHRADND